MRCPVCDATTVVLETRGGRRRRECFNEHRFTTQEEIVKDRVAGAVAMVLAGAPRRNARDEHAIFPTSLRRGLRAAGVPPLPVGRPKKEQK